MKHLQRTWAEIDLSAIRNNYRIIRGYHGEVYPVIKADAYGHGAPEVAEMLEKEGVTGFAVSNIEEAEQLRDGGIRGDILILGYTPPECADWLAEENIIQCVFSPDYARELDRQAAYSDVCVRTHLKLDTGMGRIGFDCRTDELAGIEAAKQALGLAHLRTEGVFMHFAAADSIAPEDRTFTAGQYGRFLKAVSILEQDGFRFSVKHCNNSAAILDKKQEKLDAVRAGIILYGLSPSGEVRLPESFRPAMSLYSVVSMVKKVAAGQSVSYGRTYCTEGMRTIATVTAGYADGVPRLLSNRGSVCIRGKLAPIVGRVCMDQFCVDVTDIPGAVQGDRVTIFGPELSVETVAEQADTIPYEIICGISKRVPRIYRDGEL